jgi:hypothetical protein
MTPIRTANADCVPAASSWQIEDHAVRDHHQNNVISVVEQRVKGYKPDAHHRNAQYCQEWFFLILQHIGN